MDRSSGILIFSSAYIICILAIICLLQIKYDKSHFQSAELFTPATEQLGSLPTKPRLYVVRNPIKPDYPIENLRRERLPNVLVATLPAENKAFKRMVQKATVGVLKNTPEQQIVTLPNSLVSKTTAPRKPLVNSHPELPVQTQPGAWYLFSELDRYLPFSFSNGSRQSADPVSVKLQQPELLSTSQNQPPMPSLMKMGSPRITPVREAGFKRPLSLPADFVGAGHHSAPMEPHLVIAHDSHNHARIHDSLQHLLQTSVDSALIHPIQDELNEVIDNGPLDSSLCEAALYRILDQIAQLKLAERNAEDHRLLIDVKAELSLIIHHWIDLLNGIETPVSDSDRIPDESPVQLESVDFQKLNIAIQSLIIKRFF